MDIKIWIENQLADLPQTDLNLNLTYALKDRSGIAINTGTRSEYSFELPATKQNDSIYNRFWNIGEDTQDEQMFLDARIEVDGVPFFAGKCQMKSVTIRQDLYYWQGKGYKVAFYGNNVDWVTQLGTKYLYQYDFGTHTYSQANNLVAWGNVYPTFDYKYILFKERDWATFGVVNPLESTPALFIRSIIKAIFQDLDYTLDSTFLNTDFFERLILPVPLPDKLGEDYSDDYLRVEANKAPSPLLGAEGPIIINNQTYTPAVGPNPYNTGTGQYTVPADGYYLFKIRVNLTNFVGLGCGFATIINVNGIAQPETFGDNSGYTYTTDTTITGEVVYQLSAGDVVIFAYASLIIGGGADYEYFIEITGEAEIKDNTLLDFKYLLNKNWNALNFIKGLAHAFNLTFQTDVDARIVTIEPADTYLYEQKNPNTRTLNDGFYNGSVVDKTQYIDLLKGGEVKNVTEFEQNIVLKWKDDSNDPTAEALNELNDLEIHSARFSFLPNRFKDGQKVIDNPFFAPTVMLIDNEIKDATSSKSPMIPLAWSKNWLEESTSNERPTDLEPRLLVSDAPLDAWNGIIQVDIGGGTISPVACPYAYMVDYNDTNGYQISLSFGTHTVNGFEIKGLLERFYLSDFVRMQGAKNVECYLFWDLVQLNNLDFRNKVQINGDNYILQEINSFSVTSNRSTKTFLVYDWQGDGTENTQIEITESVAKVG